MMNGLRTKWWLLFAAALAVSCGGPIQEVELHGYAGEKMQAKYITRVFKTKLADGSPGFRLETDFTYAVGNTQRIETTNKVLVHEDMTLAESETRINKNGTKSDIVTKVGTQEIMLSLHGDEPVGDTEKKIALDRPVYHIHPMLYVRELTKPGQEKTYHTINETRFLLQDLKVIYQGEVTLKEGGRTFQARHYKVENSQEPDTYLDHYVDAAGKQLKIVYPQMEFRFYR